MRPETLYLAFAFDGQNLIVGPMCERPNLAYTWLADKYPQYPVREFRLHTLTMLVVEIKQWLIKEPINGKIIKDVLRETLSEVWQNLPKYWTFQ